jgi:CRISPR-associated protein Csb1
MTTLTDKLLESKTVALVGKQDLKLAGWLEDEDKQIISVFPPSYARGKGEEKGSEYVCNKMPDGTESCDLDSPQSQANRLEPLFGREPLSNFVPQHKISLPEGEKSLFEIGHRVADAAVRFSNGKPFEKLEKAMSELNNGNALPMARLAPTSLIFGFWDSRGGSKIKRPRLLSATIRARDVVELKRGAQYTPASRYESLASLGKKRAKLGLDDVPDRGLGGLLVRGGITRNLQINMVALREILGKDEKEKDVSGALQKYLLGLLLLLLHEDEQNGTLNLRQGCLLVGPKPDWHLVRRDGTNEQISLPTADEIKTQIKDALDHLGGKEEGLIFEFSAEKAKEVAKNTKDDNSGK